jgi:hypothetical protein
VAWLVQAQRGFRVVGGAGRWSGAAGSGGCGHE